MIDDVNPQIFDLRSGANEVSARGDRCVASQASIIGLKPTVHLTRCLRRARRALVRANLRYRVIASRASPPLLEQISSKNRGRALPVKAKASKTRFRLHRARPITCTYVSGRPVRISSRAHMRVFARRCLAHCRKAAAPRAKLLPYIIEWAATPGKRVLLV